MSESPLSAGPGPRTSTARYLASSLRRRGSDAVVVLALTVLQGTVLGAELLLLVPLLGLVGLGATGGELGPVEEGVLAVLRASGLPITLPSVLAVFVAVSAAGLLLDRWRSLAVARLEAGAAADLRRRLFRSVTGMEWIAFTRTPSASLAFALTEGVGTAGAMLGCALGVVAQACILGAYLALSFAVAPAMTLLCAALGALLLLASRGWFRRGAADGEEAADAAESLWSTVQEHLGAGKVTRGHGLEGAARSAFDAAADRAAAEHVALERGMADARTWFSLAAVATLAVLVWVARAVLLQGPASLLLLLFLFSRIVPRLARIREDLHSLATMEPKVRAVASLSARCDSVAEGDADPAAGPSFEGAVAFEGVTMHLGGGDGPPALADVDLEIAAGEAVAVVGPSGAGKTTLADLAVGLLVPASGRVLADGEPLEGARRRAWRSRVGYVPQETFLFHDTVRANLLYARPAATEAELRRALEQAGAADLVDRLPGGMDEVLGDRGSRLSGGERQRLALARALLRRPAILVLDEATGSLDADSETRILAALAALRGTVTVLFITHRPAAARRMDRIVTLVRGRVVESGRVSGRARAVPVVADREGAIPEAMEVG